MISYEVSLEIYYNYCNSHKTHTTIMIICSNFLSLIWNSLLAMYECMGGPPVEIKFYQKPESFVVMIV